MQSLSLHIEYLLRSHECVILPGIGAFLRTYRAASILEDGTLRAPSSQICFNSSIVASDGLLAHSVARRCKISFEQANVLVSNAAEQCRNALTSNGEFAFGKLGRLNMDSEGRISFMPYSTLYSNIWSDISTSHQSSDAAADKADAPVNEKLPSKNSNDYYIIKVSRKVVRYAAVSAICLFTAATALLPSASRSGDTIIADKQYASVVPVVEKIVPSSYAKEKEEMTMQPAIDETPTVSVVNSDKYYLIVATFSKESDCKKYIEAQEDKQNLHIIESGKVCRVYSASSDNRSDLSDMMKTPEHKALHPQAWIWEDPNAAV